MNGSQGPGGTVHRARRRGGRENLILGRLAGALLLSGTFASIPANILLTNPDPGAEIHLLNLLGLLSGIACLLAPWDRMPWGALHLIPAAATAEIVLTVSVLGLHGQIYLWFFLLGSVFSGYAFKRRRHVAIHTAMACAGFIGTQIYARQWDQDALVQCVVAVPTLAVAAAAVAYLREQMEARQQRLIELTEAHELEARTDALTGLGNRRSLMEHLESACAPGQRASLFALFDLDGFKDYNDRFGHPAGDALLERLGARLSQCVAGRGTAFRLGGDEFCVLLDVAEGDHEPQLAACLEALSDRGPGFELEASHGAALLPAEGPTPSVALSVADGRMYSCKGERRGRRDREARDVLLALQRERRRGSRGNSIDVAELARATARRLGLDHEEIDVTVRAAELHDIGKAAIPEQILNKPGPLNDAEWEFVRGHTVIGERILTAAAALRPVARLVRSSHERYDGRGYPDNLAADDIPLGARIIAVCDAFEAMISSDRPYGSTRSPYEATRELEANAGTQFDPEVVAAFVAEMLHVPTLEPGIVADVTEPPEAKPPGTPTPPAQRPAS